MLTSGNKMSSIRRDRPISTPAVTPAQAANAKPNERVKGMMRQHAARSELRKSCHYRFQRREKLRRENAEMRDDLPQCPNHHERTGIAPGELERAFLPGCR